MTVITGRVLDYMDTDNGFKKVFLIGIGGVGMSAIAVILKERGVSVSGSDRSESTMTKNLAKKGIEVLIGHRAENITPDTQAVVYTNAISEDNPEFVRAKELGIPVIERAFMLDLVARSKFAIGISGTHGKTTTTSMVSKILLKSGFDPSLAVGGFLKEIDGSGYEGDGKYFVYEACEAYSSFLKLHPNIAIITNIDADHLDYYKTFKNIKKAFAKYIKENVPAYGLVVYNKDDKHLRKVVQQAKSLRALSVGIKQKKADFTAGNITLDSYSSSFTVSHKGKEIGRFTVNIPGMHNVTNSLLAIAASQIIGAPYESIRESLANFKNADRRFEVKHTDAHLTVIDDYAHHPSEIEATLLAARNLSNHQKAQLIAIFQPHLYSRTEMLYKDFAKSLSMADQVVLTEVYAARENNDHNVSSQMIFDEIVRIKGAGHVSYTKNLKEVPDTIRGMLNGNNVVVTLGAGDVWKISELLHCSH